jgi:hypothetical protein
MHTQTDTGHARKPHLKSKAVPADAPARKPRKTASIASRHAAKTDKSGGLFACWLWKPEFATFQQSGYGAFRAPSRVTGKSVMRSAHAVAWEIANGCAVPEGKIVRHVCHHPLCQNPSHLLLGTEADNRADDKAAGKVYTRLKPAQIILVAALRDKSSAAAVAKQFNVGVTTVRNIWRGKSHKRTTGFVPEDRTGTTRGRKLNVSAVPAPAPLPTDIINLDDRRKRKAAKPALMAVAH